MGHSDIRKYLCRPFALNLNDRVEYREDVRHAAGTIWNVLLLPPRCAMTPQPVFLSSLCVIPSRLGKKAGLMFGRKKLDPAEMFQQAAHASRTGVGRP